MVIPASIPRAGQRKKTVAATFIGLWIRFAMLWKGKVILVVRVEGLDRKSFFAVAESPNGIDNFRYLDYLPREQLRYSLSAADVHLLTLRSDMAGIAVPGKLYGIMAAGRPVVMVGPEASEPAQTILAERIGAVIDPDHEGGRDRPARRVLRDAPRRPGVARGARDARPRRLPPQLRADRGLRHVGRLAPGHRSGGHALRSRSRLTSLLNSDCAALPTDC